MYGDFTAAQRNPIFFMLTWLDREPLLRLFPKRRKAHQDLTKFLNKLDEIIIHKRQVLEGTIKNDEQPVDDHNKDLLTLMLEAQQHDGESAMTNEELKVYKKRERNEKEGWLTCVVHIEQPMRFLPCWT